MSTDQAGDPWEVPDFHEMRLIEKSKNYALVIPVINEGRRIQEQLRKIQAANLAVDVVIADGGSVDGSLEECELRQLGVTTLLTKTGPGKLSAQLRMAYSWCLKQGYAGIVTIDGNGKDGVEAVTAMAACLNKGFDYVQGSRYLPGGLAENTPLERTIGNRLIHAPLLSLAAGKWFTDTTNGFRAYSAKFLLDPRVQPFRNVFMNYELLFYLTMRAGQIGATIAHVPVIRRYPADGTIPTKISSLSSKLRVLAQTIAVITGGYTAETCRLRFSTCCGVVACLLIAGVLFATNYPSPPYSPDSWAYYELSKTVFDDFYRFHHFRSFWTDSPYSSSFPPAFPVLIGSVDSIFHTGARTGVLLAFVSFLVFVVSTEIMSRRVFRIPHVGFAMAIILLLSSSMLPGEMVAGRSIPLQMLILSGCLWCMFYLEKLNPAGILLFGAISGLAVMNRFDAILLPVLLAAYVAKDRGFWKTLAFSAGVLAAISPWIAYSLLHFGVVFVTDNASVATSLDSRAFVTDWWPEPQPSVIDDIPAWISKVLFNTLRFLGTLARVMLSNSGLVLIAAVILVLAILGFCHFGRSTRVGVEIVERLNVSANRTMLRFVFALFAMLLPQILTGYFDERYFTALLWSAGICALWMIIGAADTQRQRNVLASLVLCFAIGAGLIGMLAAATAAFKASDRELGQGRFDDPDEVRDVMRCFPRGEEVRRVLVLGDDTMAARLGAQGNLHTLMEPSNMLRGRLGPEGVQQFLRAWNVNYILLADDRTPLPALQDITLRTVSNCKVKLFRIMRG